MGNGVYSASYSEKIVELRSRKHRAGRLRTDHVCSVTQTRRVIACRCMDILSIIRRMKRPALDQVAALIVAVLAICSALLGAPMAVTAAAARPASW